MTKMYFKVVDDYTEGEEYDDSGVEYEVWENTSSGSKTVATVGNGQALLLKAYTKARWVYLSYSSGCYIYSSRFILGKSGKFKAYGHVGALDGYYTKLDTACYNGMFYNCSSLIKAPELPATTLAVLCYGGGNSLSTRDFNKDYSYSEGTRYQNGSCGMFENCTGLTEVPELPATELANYCYAKMFFGCTGLTSLPENLLPATKLESCCYRFMFYGCTSLTTLPENLLPATELTYECYQHMFYGCTSLTTLPENLLPATELTYECYQHMFYGCTSLTTLPENLLPATELTYECYQHMFYGCTSLTTLPENLLPATELTYGCYQYMFHGCTSLTTLPENLLPATTLTNSCYSGMFYGCTGLTTLPENLLPATTLATECYTGMFNGCTGLTSLPENLLPATTLATDCYGSGESSVYASSGMFGNCTGLTTLPENFLPATTLAKYCYVGMFYGCTSLTTLPENLLPATELQPGCYTGMFQNCTSLNTLPETLLPALEMVDGSTSGSGSVHLGCYCYMFYGCTSLIKAPELPATTLAFYCYNQMFCGCSKLNYIKALFTTTPGSGYTYGWVSGVASSGTFVKNFQAEWDVTGASGIPSGWTVELNATHVSWDSLKITANDVNGRRTTTIIHYTLTETMLNEDGVTQGQRTITGNAVSDAFEQNTSYTDTITRTITYKDTQSGLTATTTITQGVWVDADYTVDLNSQWQESSKNPDSSLYDCYESFSNYHVANANAIMYITIVGYTEFSLYIRSYGESNCDYVVVGNLDATSISRTTSGVKATTYGNSQSGTTISSYTKVTFSGLDGGEHKIPILYGKDGSADSGDDKGYIIIEKNQ